jgi:hypothetical protein
MEDISNKRLKAIDWKDEYYNYLYGKYPDDGSEYKLGDIPLNLHLKINLVRHFEWYDGSRDICDFEIIVPIKSLNNVELYDNIAAHIFDIFTPNNTSNLTKNHSVMTDVFEIFNIDYEMGDEMHYILVINSNPKFKINKALNP